MFIKKSLTKIYVKISVWKTNLVTLILFSIEEWMSLKVLNFQLSSLVSPVGIHVLLPFRTHEIVIRFPYVFPPPLPFVYCALVRGRGSYFVPNTHICTLLSLCHSLLEDVGESIMTQEKAFVTTSCERKTNI